MSKVSLGTDKITPNVRSSAATGENEQLVFTFAKFHLKPVNIDGEFNNFYSSENEYVSNLPIFGHFCHPIFAHKSTKKAAEAAVL